MTLAERVYRAALHACPASFRDEFGDESTRHFTRLVEDTRRARGRLAVAALVGRAVVDLLHTAFRERRRLSVRSILNAVPQTFRDAYRALAAAPGFSLLVVTTLAVGMGANSAIFDAFYETTLRPLPFPEPEELTMVWESDVEAGDESNDVTPANFEDWRALNTSFEDLAAMVQTSMNLTGDGDPERLNVYRVSSSLFSILGVEPVHGRGFLVEEDRPGVEPVALLTHGFWERRFGGNGPDGPAGAVVLGEDIVLDGERHRIVGVLPAWFGFPSRDTAVFVPLAMDNEESALRTSHYLDVVGRLGAGVSLAQASEEMDAIAARLAELHPDSNADNGVLLRPLRDDLLGDGATPLMVLFLAVSAVVLIAVVNVANLLLARSTRRSQEIAVRAALGANRARIIAQLLTESALLAFSGASAGLVLAAWARGLLRGLTPAYVALDSAWWRPTTTVFALVLALAVTAGMGILPALQLSRGGQGSLLGLRGFASRASSRFRSALIVVEVAGALILLVLGGVMARSFFNLARTPSGIRTENVLTMRIELSGSRYQEHHQKVAFYRELESRVGRLPGVQSSGFVTMLPFTFQGGSIMFGIEHREIEGGAEPIAVFRSVSSGYFRTLGIPVLAGRAFGTRDGADAPRVVVINRALARTFFPGSTPLGERLDIWGDTAEIVGVVSDVRQFALDQDARPAIYVASAQRSFGFFDPRDFAVHTRGDPSRLVSTVRAEVWSIDPEQPIASIRTMDDIVGGAVANDRLQTLLLSAFGIVALVLAALGIYGVLSYTVAQRRDEIGLRMALGARSGDVMRLIAGQGIVLALAGIALGLVAAAAISRVLEGMLHGVEPFDSWTVVIVAGILGAVALTACVVPGLRATRIDPLVAMRSE